MPTLQEKFRGCLLGAAIGDVVGAPVEAESAAYIAKTHQSIDDILATPRVAEFTGPDWIVGRFTDDTQMTISVAQWLIEDRGHDPAKLLERFVKAYEPWRRYGPGTENIFRLFPRQREKWRDLSTVMFPHGSYGNGGAMRVAPVGLAYHNNLKKATSVALDSSRPTHSHPLAYQGAVCQGIAVASAVALRPFTPSFLLRELKIAIGYFSDLMQDTSKFTRAISLIEQGLERRASCAEMSNLLGNGIAAHEAVPMALYCFLRHSDSYAEAISQAVFIGGDTDTIACMTGALSGALLGEQAIPARWVNALREEVYTAQAIAELADRLYAAYFA